MVDQRAQDGRRGRAAERTDKGPVVVTGVPLPAAVAGGDAGGVVEWVRKLGVHCLIRRSNDGRHITSAAGFCNTLG